MKRYVIMIVAVLAVCILWMGAWFVVAGQVRAEIEVLVEADGITQPRLVCDHLDVGGAPFSFSPHCTGATITSGDTTLALPAIAGTALFYRPFHVQLFATGPARISDAFSGSVQQVDWSNLHASLRLADGALERFSVVADDLVYANVLMGENRLGTATHGEAHLIDSTAPDRQPGTGMAFDFYATLEGVQSAPLDLVGGRLVLDGRLTGVPDPALWGHPDLVAFWQAYDGRLVLRDLEAFGEGISLTAQGEAGLQSTGLLEGTLDITSRGISGRIGQMVGDPAIADIMLGNPDDTGVSHQTLTLRDGAVIVGIIPVATLPPLF